MLWLLMTTSPIQADFDAQSLALNCLICHESGEDPAADDIPGLAGLSSAELYQALLDFKYDKRAATLMPRIAKGYSDAQLQAVADWLSQ